MSNRPYNGFTSEERGLGANWWRKAVKAGSLPAPTGPCDGCGGTRKVANHSEDYGPPFGPHCGVFRVCFRCHMAIHCRYKRPERWALYLDVLACGGRWLPCAAWPEFFQWWYVAPMGDFLRGSASRLIDGPRGQTELHKIDAGVYYRDAARRRVELAGGGDPGPGLVPESYRAVYETWESERAARQ